MARRFTMSCTAMTPRKGSSPEKPARPLRSDCWHWPVACGCRSVEEQIEQGLRLAPLNALPARCRRILLWTRPRLLPGRPLFAAHASLPWPDQPHLVLWHAQTLLREFRGDGHLTALVGEGLDGVEALITHAASGDVPAEVLRATRAWPEAAWAAGEDRLRARGLLAGDGLTFTDAGRALRQRIEDLTDQRSTAPYEVLGDDGCERLRTLGRVLSRRVVDAGLLQVDPSRYLD